MVLLGDIVGEDDAVVAAATSEIVRLANARSGEGFIAVSSEARKKFWLDRAKTAAIAKHTNAFKINEDVVIPLERLGEYTDAIERINIELSIQNKLELTDALAAYFAARRHRPRPGRRFGLDAGSDIDTDRRAAARALIERVRARWQYLLGSMDMPMQFCAADLESLGIAPRQTSGTLFDRLQDRSIRVSWKSELRAELARIFVGSDLCAHSRRLRCRP
jgi:FAD/FMN-containing dehydrogenase